MKKILFPLFLYLCLQESWASPLPADSLRYPADHPFIRYTGRTEPAAGGPRFWNPGVYLTLRFRGTYCVLEITDEQKWGNSQNYISIVVDKGAPRRIQTTGSYNRIVLATGLTDGVHEVLICKDTEAGIGYLQPLRVTCPQLLPAATAPRRRIEFYGNSITCGMGSDQSQIACGEGKWYDQHNAYRAYGPVTARALGADWQLTSESGIGLIHSCCDKPHTMPEVYDKVNLAEDSLRWNFNNYQPDLVSICLGQNDGIQDSLLFCSAYVSFIRTLRVHYPKASIVLLSSPMASPELRQVLQRYILSIRQTIYESGDHRIGSYFFRKQYTSGCSSHPSLNEQAEIAAELTAFLRGWLKW